MRLEREHLRIQRVEIRPKFRAELLRGRTYRGEPLSRAWRQAVRCELGNPSSAKQAAHVAGLLCSDPLPPESAGRGGYFTVTCRLGRVGRNLRVRSRSDEAGPGGTRCYLLLDTQGWTGNLIHRHRVTLWESADCKATAVTRSYNWVLADAPVMHGRDRARAAAETRRAPPSSRLAPADGRFSCCRPGRLQRIPMVAAVPQYWDLMADHGR